MSDVTSDDSRPLKVLALCHEGRDCLGDAARIGRDTVCLAFDELTSERLAAEAPDVVLCRLMTESFDVIDVARRLHDLGYRGILTSLAGRVPRPELIRAEVADVAPGLAFDLLMLQR